MKILRWVFFSIMGVSLIGGLYTGLRLYYIVFFTQLFVVLSVEALNLWTVYSFKYKQTLSSETCDKGKGVVLHLEIINEFPLPLSLIEAHIDVVSVRENINLVFSLAPYSGQTFEIPITTPYRGRYMVGMTVLKITDIFGLTVQSFDMRKLSYYRLTELVVLPRALTPGAVAADISDTKLFGDAYLKPADSGDSVSGARQYHDGDAMKRIHWKKSAQLATLFVKQYEYPEREHIAIFIDTSLHGLSGEPALVYADTVTECAASIARHSLARGRAVHLLGRSMRPIVCPALHQFGTLRRQLALLAFGGQTDIAADMDDACKKDPNMHALFIITRGSVPSPAETLSRTRAGRLAATVVLVGGAKIGGSLHTIFVDEGSVAADALSGIR